MKTGGLLAAVGVLAVLGGLVWYTGQHPGEDKDSKSAASAIKLISMDAGQMTEIRLIKTGEPAIVLRKISDIWQIVEPKKLEADSEVVSPLTGSLASVNADRLIDEHPTSLKEFGLETPAFEIDVTGKDGKVHKLLTGTDAPGSGNIYAKLDGEAKLYTIPSAVKSAADKSLNDLRDKRLLTFNQNKMKSMKLAAKGPEIEFGKNAQADWVIVKPRALRADPLQAQDLIRKLIDARMDLTGESDEKKVAEGFAGGARIAVASATDEKETQSIEVRKANDGTYYAKSSVLEGIYKIVPDIAEGMNKSVDDYRDKRIFDFGFTDPSRVEINGQAYDKAGEKWTANQVQFDPATVQAAIDKIRDLSAVKFSETMSGAKALTLAVTSGEKKIVEKVTINKAGDSYNVQREGEPPVYVIDAKAFDDLQKAVAGIKQQLPAKTDAGKKK